MNFIFDGADAGLAELNAALVRAQVGVVLVEEAQTSLHELYLKIAERSTNAGPA